jgi:hypothetical protein
MLQTSGTIKLSEIKTEFGGASTLYGYRRGGGLVASHSNNSGISASAPQIRQFLGASNDFSSAGGSTYTSDTYDIAVANGYYTEFYDPLYTIYTVAGVSDGGEGYPNQAIGTFGSYATVGTSKSSTSTTSIVGIFDYYQDDMVTYNSRAYTLQFSAIYFSGNPGAFWTSVTANGLTKYRSNCTNTSGDYFSGVNVTRFAWITPYWDWNFTANGGINNFSIVIA